MKLINFIAWLINKIVRDIKNHATISEILTQLHFRTLGKQLMFPPFQKVERHFQRHQTKQKNDAVIKILHYLPQRPNRP